MKGFEYIVKIKVLTGLLVLAVAFTYMLYKYSDNKYDKRLNELIFDNTTYKTENALEILNILLDTHTSRNQVKTDTLLMLAKNRDAIGYYSNLLLAKRYEEEKKDATVYYRTALELYPNNGIRFKLAAFLNKKGKRQDAVDEYLKLLPDKTALQALNDMNIEPEKVSMTLIDKKAWKTVEEFLGEKFVKTSYESMDAVLRKHYARALAEQGKYEQALPFFESLYTSDNGDADIAWWYGRSLEKTEQIAKAKEIYSSIGEKGAYNLGIILEKEGLMEEAANAFSRSSETVSKWKAAHIWEELGMIEQALNIYLLLAETESSYQDDAAYRTYILSEQLGKEDTDMLIKVLSAHPAWMERIGREPIWNDTIDVDYVKPEFLKRVEIYEQNEKEETAKIELAIGSNSASAEEKLALGDWYQEREDYYNSIVWGIRSLKDKSTKKGYELAYPQAYKELTYELSRKYNVEAALIWAIVREESYYRHDVVSQAGAMGLMQIMPATGKDIASRLKKNIEDNDLLNPEINMELGTYYIRSMLDMFSQDIDKALAAYNGGPGNVTRWSKSKLGTSVQDFPTAITFFETQEYITKVKNSYLIYKWLYPSE